MKSYSLCQDICPELIPVTISDRLGDGADGEVFNIIDAKDQVIKFSILYDYGNPVEQEYQRIEKVLSFLQENKPVAYAQVFKHSKLATSYRNTFNGKQEYLLYYYIMQKCNKISDDEKRVFHTILSHEDRGIGKKYSQKMIKQMLLGLAKGLDFDINKVLTFCNAIADTLVNHSDIHPRNIMKDGDGNFKLIDFDRANLEST